MQNSGRQSSLECNHIWNTKNNGSERDRAHAVLACPGYAHAIYYSTVFIYCNEGWRGGANQAGK